MQVEVLSQFMLFDVAIRDLLMVPPQDFAEGGACDGTAISAGAGSGCSGGSADTG